MAINMWTIVERIVRCNIPIKRMKLVNRAGLSTISKKLNHVQQQPLTKSTRFRFCFPSGHRSSSCSRGFLNFGCQILFRDIRWRLYKFYFKLAYFIISFHCKYVISFDDFTSLIYIYEFFLYINFKFIVYK